MDSAALPRPLRVAPSTWRGSELRDLPGHANLLWHARSAASAHAREPPCKLGRPVIRPSIPAVAGLPRQAARRPGARPPLARSRPAIPRAWRGRGAAGTYAAVLAQQQRSFIGSGAGADQLRRPPAPGTLAGSGRTPPTLPYGSLAGEKESSCWAHLRAHARVACVNTRASHAALCRRTRCCASRGRASRHLHSPPDQVVSRERASAKRRPATGPPHRATSSRSAASGHWAGLAKIGGPSLCKT